MVGKIPSSPERPAHLPQARAVIITNLGGRWRPPQSFARAGTLGLPLMVAVIGGETHRFSRLIDIYRKAGAEAGHAQDRLKVGLHSIGYVGNTTREANDDFYPGYAETFNKVGKERGWPPVTRANYDAQAGH